MTYTPPNNSTIPTEGIDFTQTYYPYNPSAAQSSTNTPDYPGTPFLPGERVFSANGAEFMFVLAGSAITVNQAVGITPVTCSAAPLTKALADAGAEFAVAPVAIASGYYGWVQTKGAASVTLKNSCLPNVALYTTASAGMLDDTSASQTRVYGVRAQVTSTSSGSAKLCWVTNTSV